MRAWLSVTRAPARRASPRARRSRATRVVSLAAALGALALVRLIPIAGAIVAFLALVSGLGAWTTRAYRAWAGAPTA